MKMNFLINEYLIAFIDNLSVPLGLPEKDVYSFNEVEHALKVYLPIWIEEAISIPGVHSGGGHYIDPNILLSQKSLLKSILILMQAMEKLQQ